MRVVGRDAGDGTIVVSDPSNGRGENVGQLGADDQQPLGIGLGGRDLQQRHRLAGVRNCVLDKAVMAELGEFFDPDPGVPQRFDRRPGPKRSVLLARRIPTLGVLGVLDPHPRHGIAASFGAMHGPVPDGEGGTGLGGLGGLQAGGCRQPFIVDPSLEHRQEREPLPGPLVHPRLAGADLLLACEVFWADGTRRGPLSPAGRVFHRPLCNVEIKATHRCQSTSGLRSTFGDLGRLTVCSDDSSSLHRHALLPCCRDLGRQMQRGNAGVVAFQIAPEQPSQVEGQVPQGRVVEHRLALGQVRDEQVTNRAAGDAMAVDQLGRTELAARAEGPERGRGF